MKPRGKTRVIEPITDPIGRSWNQPKSSNILINDEFAYMSQRDFNDLANYSSSFPSGVYPGKMWKAERLKRNGLYYESTGKWFLRWYSTHPEKPMELCCNNEREIVILTDDVAMSEKKVAEEFKAHIEEERRKV